MRVGRLVKQAKKGNKEALLQLINEQQDDYYRLALTYMGNSDDAMDALEDMIVSLYQHIAQLKKNEAFYSWSKTILVNRYSGAIDGIQLVADGVPIEMTGSSSTSSFNGTALEVYFDSLPKKVSDLKLIVDTFVGYTEVKKTFSLEDIDVALGLIPEKELFVRKVEKTEEGLQLTIVTAEDVLLEGVSVQVKDLVIPLTTTLRQDYIEDEVGTSYKERILLFDVNELPETLYVEGIHYQKSYEQSIDIKVN